MENEYAEMAANGIIPNVPRELLEVIEQTWRIHCNGGPGTTDIAADAIEKGLGQLRALLSAPSPAGVDADHVEDVRAMVADPSPAGVDGLEVVGWYRMDDRKAITPYPSVCATWHKMGVKVGAAYSDSAHAIIDGLRGENERIRLNIAEYNEAIACYQSERDQQAQRIGALAAQANVNCKNTAYYLRKYRPDLADICSGWCVAIDAALSAGKEWE